MKKKWLILFALMLAIVPVSAVASPAAACVEGYTPGYWKNFEKHTWVTYQPTDKITDVFGVSSAQTAPYYGPNASLMDALKNGGGGVYALMRQTVAQLLNETLIGHPTAWQTDLVKAVFANPNVIAHSLNDFSTHTGNVEGWKNYIESFHTL